ncbi:MAG TPA: DeoR/GlpR family DNA-binding transcription regulator [Aerococcus urinaeequi]|nr:DeoR/GlpR family DNA-binding transcription regulator [Aerococcus urinaeequi]
MLLEERKTIILDYLNQHHTVDLQTLVTMTSASESTLRRDLDSLEDEGLLIRVHGGAKLKKGANPVIGEEPRFSDKVLDNANEKRMIAQYAVSLIEKGETIYLDAGTTSLLMLDFITPDMQLNIITNGVNQAIVAAGKGLNIQLLGGTLRANTQAIVGQSAHKQLKKYHFHHVFLGMNGIDLNDGLTTTDEAEAFLKEQAAYQSIDVHVMIDQSKFEKTYPITVTLNCEFQVVTNIFKDRHAKEDFTQVYKIKEVNN